MVLLNLMYAVVLTFEPFNEILRCGPLSNSCPIVVQWKAYMSSTFQILSVRTLGTGKIN